MNQIHICLALLCVATTATAQPGYNPNPGPASPAGSAYGVTPPGYTPPQTYNQPQQNYAAPQQSYTPPQQSYVAPQQTYTPPQQSYAPPANYGTPSYSAPNYQAPVGQGYAAPQQNFAAPIVDPAFNDPYAGFGGPGSGPDPLAPVLSLGPQIREADLIINGYPARTGRIMLGGAVNSDAGVTGQITIDERNFDITRIPTSFADLRSGTAFRGAGQTFRLEAAPGSSFKRYTASFANPNLLGYLPLSLSLSGFLFDRRFDSWDEERLGGRVALGYRVTPDLSFSMGLSGQNVEISNPEVDSIPELNRTLGDNSLYGGEFRLIHDTRNTTIQASEGHYLELGYQANFGDFDYSRFDIEYRQYFLVAQRADGTGRQTLSYSTKIGYTGDDTPIFENYFAGGYATLRGFRLRGASPAVELPGSNVYVGGKFQFLNSVEYKFPITADDAFRGVGFVDFGTVEPEAKLSSDDFRVAPGVGLRVAIPMLGPAPLAFDFAFPVAKADTDRTQTFSFYMSLVR